jgi:hypothetical protein
MGFALGNQQRHSNIDWSHAIRRPKKSEITNRTRNTPNRILAIPAAVPAILEKPNSAAIRAMIDQDNIGTSLYTDNYISQKAVVQFMMFLTVPRKGEQGYRAFP